MSEERVYPPIVGSSRTVKRPEVTVEVDGAAADWLEPLEVIRRPGPALNRARFRSRPADSAEQGRFEQLGLLTQPGQEVIVKLVDPEGVDDDMFLFKGIIAGGNSDMHAKAEGVIVTAVDAVTVEFDKAITALRAINPGGGSVVAAVDEVVFNDRGTGNRSANTAAAGCYIFDGDSEAAQPWTVLEALKYLVYEYLDSDLLDPVNRTELAAQDAILMETEITGLTPLEALEKVAGRLTWRFRMEYRDDGGQAVPRLIFYTPAAGRIMNLRLQAPGETFDPTETNVISCEMKTTSAGMTYQLIGRGSRRQFESTFELVEGWDQSLEQNDINLYSPATNTNFAGVRNVFRRYVLNETGRYSAPPYNQGAAADLSDVLGTAEYLRRTRRFYPCLCCDPDGSSYGFYLEVSYDDGSTWQPYGGAFDVLRDECGIYLNCEQFEPAVWVAICKDVLKFRMTATIESDEPLEVRMVDGPDDGSRPVKTRLMDFGSLYACRQVHAGSFLAGGAVPTGPSREIDDTAKLQGHLSAALPALRCRDYQGRVRLMRLWPDALPGDRIETIEGRDIDCRALVGSTVFPPQAQAVRFELNEQWTTTFEF